MGIYLDNPANVNGDASGRTVQQNQVQFISGKGLLNINELSSGIYIVNVQSAENSFNQKVYINK